jgi:AbrB family looped-hinge helix DNA binding protein
MTNQNEVKVGAEGRVLLPASVRRAAGVEPGSILVVRVEGDRIVLTPREAIKRRLHEMFSGIEGSMSEELIAERRIEAERGAAEGS